MANFGQLTLVLHSVSIKMWTFGENKQATKQAKTPEKPTNKTTKGTKNFLERMQVNIGSIGYSRGSNFNKYHDGKREDNAASAR